MITEYVEDFQEFYDKYKEHIHKHIKDWLKTDKELDINTELFQTLINSGNSNFFVVKDNDEFIGYISISITPSILVKDTVDVVIDHTYIAEEFRGQGYFNKFLVGVEQQLIDEGVDSINVAVPKEVEYLEKQGYVKQSIIYSKKLRRN